MSAIQQKMAFMINLWTINTITSKKIDGCLGSIHGIGFTEYMVLFHLSNAHNTTMRRIDLANKLGLSASGVTRLVSPMEKIGLVKKSANPRDARVSLVKLTASSVTVLRDATASLKEISKQILHDINEKNLKETLDVFNCIGKDLYIN